MDRIVVAALLGALVAPSAFAHDDEGACILTATHSITGSKKPPIITLKLDCGSKPSADEQRHVDMVGNQQNIADGVRYMLGAGFEVAAATVMNSYTGNSIISTYVFAPHHDAAAGQEEAAPMKSPASEERDLDEFEGGIE